MFDDKNLEPGPFCWFGGFPNECLPDLNEFPVARHTKGNAEGIKNPRANVRVVPLSGFEAVDDIGQLSVKLFGDAVAAAGSSI